MLYFIFVLIFINYYEIILIKYSFGLSASTSTFFDCCNDVKLELCEKLKKSIREYFTLDNLSMFIQKPLVSYFIIIHLSQIKNKIIHFFNFF